MSGKSGTERLAEKVGESEFEFLRLLNIRSSERYLINRITHQPPTPIKTEECRPRSVNYRRIA